MKSRQQGISKVAIIIIIALLIIIAGGTTAWLTLGSSSSTVTTASDEPARSADPIYYKLEPFTVNLKRDNSGMGDRLLYIGITLSLGNEETQRFVDKYLPQIRGNLLMALSDQDAPTLITREGKTALAKRIKETVEQKIIPSQPILLVDDVLFTQLIVQ